MTTVVFAASCVALVIAVGAMVWARRSLKATQASAREATQHADRAERAVAEMKSWKP